MRVRKAALAAFLAFSALAAPNAGAADLQPLDLRVDGGEESWQAKRDFALRWSNPPGVATVHYRLLGPSGEVVLGETTLGWPATAIQHLNVPAVPGAYTAEVWLEDKDGVKGVPTGAKLRYDNSAPGKVPTVAVGGWIGRTAFPYTLHLGRPGEPQPLSGIRGYAISIDQAADGNPCAASVCSDAETDLRGGEADDLLQIGELPEGTNYLHAVAVSGSGVASAASSNAVLRVDKTDPDTRLAGVPNGWSNQPLTLTAIATDAASGMVVSGNADGPFTAIQLDGAPPTTAPGAVVGASVIASGIHTIAYYARDAAGNVADGGAANGLANHLPATALVKIDREPPRIAFVGAQDPLDPERIEARISDPLSGLDPSRGSIAVRQAGSGERFAELPTQQSGELLRARWDSDAYPPGEYEFRAVAGDRAENSTSTLSRIGGSPMRLHSPLKIATTVQAELGRRTVRYGRAMSLSGHLFAGRQTPLAGMTVRIVERFDEGAAPRERVSTVKTTEAGSFDLRLAPGPSRRIIAMAAPTATLRGADSGTLRLTVRGGVRLRVSSTIADVGGRPIVFRGGVAGGAIPADGKTVELQFRLPGTPWSEFRTIRTDRRGHFRYAYRFADDDSRGVRFQFRAFAPAQAGWPFEPAGSARLAVRGR